MSSLIRHINVEEMTHFFAEEEDGIITARVQLDDKTPEEGGITDVFRMKKEEYEYRVQNLTNDIQKARFETALQVFLAKESGNVRNVEEFLIAVAEITTYIHRRLYKETLSRTRESIEEEQEQVIALRERNKNEEVNDMFLRSVYMYSIIATLTKGESS